MAEGETGELCCRGPYTIRGYYRAPERNREAFDAGFYRTGDLVRRHPSGNLIVEGRLKDLMNRGGEKIDAEEVEEVEGHLLVHPAVAAAAVVAMPDERLGERCRAYLTLRPGGAIDLAAMRAFLDARVLARFKWPERLEIIEQMPLSGVGKLSKAALREDIRARLAREAPGQRSRGASGGHDED